MSCLIHFPIALFIAAVAIDLMAHWTKRRRLAESAYYNLVLAAISTGPALVTGVLAWQFQLEGQSLKGILVHVIFGGASSAIIWLVWWVHFCARRQDAPSPGYRLAIEFLGVTIVALTAHLGGCPSGVDVPGQTLN